MSEEPKLLQYVTGEQAWEVVHAGEREDAIDVLRGLGDKARRELLGVSAFGESGNQKEMLSQSVDPFLLTDRTGTYDLQHIRSALLRLGIPEPGK